MKHLATVVVKDGENEYFAIQFQLLNPDSYEFVIAEPHKCSELVWADMTSVPDDTIELFKTIVGAINAGESYVEVGY